MSTDSTNIITRFAPSPTGLLHLGHAYSALFSQTEASRQGGRFLLRIEDIDPGRCRAEFEDAIYDDLSWLGLEWETPVRRQSRHMDDYDNASRSLDKMGLLYPCFCTRKDIQAEIKNAQHAPHHNADGPDGPLYPGICRELSEDEREYRIQAGEVFALRLDMGKAICCLSGPLHWLDRDRGETLATPEIFGDVVLARKDTPTSYHLAVTVDDHLQGVTLVTRGEDLMPSTHVHRLLQELLEFDVPEYRHHGLLKGSDGRRLAKRDKSLTLKALREAGKSPDDVRKMAGL
ncbi:MAG: tRNA glutamyl-Q(34) synthetase GluQRS [Rhodospirillales bacterium]|nr:tRNA glutamyl-Q(34) synthetase GluQRS [Rhodospirillales bacterium]